MHRKMALVSAIAALATPPCPSVAAASDDPGGVEVQLHTDAPDVRIDRIVDGVAVPACVAPCGRVLPRDGVYVIDGPGVPRTQPFTLSASSGARTTLDVRAGSNLRHQVGVGAIAVGGVAFLGGAAALAVVGFHDLATLGEDVPRDPWPGRLTAVMLGGVPVFVVGLVLALSSSTVVTTGNGVTFSLGPSGRPRAWKLALTPRGLEF
jgi:hypothetical protein